MTYLFIERPARSSKASAIRIFSLQYVIPAGAIAVISLGAMYVDGYGFRWQSEEYVSRLNAFRDQTRPAYKFDYVCQRQRVQVSDTRDERCVTGTDSDIGPRVILWGDSNAAHYIGVVSAIAREAGFRVRNLELGSCPPLFDDPALFVAANRLRDCRDSAEPVAAAVRASDVVIISASWSDPQTIRPFSRLIFSTYAVSN
ncbi:MAG: hypothetical protein IPL18_14645 [Sphingomonadales bacterium]|nr:hypothetical protein [Sphingomonadales bacterium]